MAFARVIAGAYEARGLDPAPALSLAQITPLQLKRPAARMTARQMEALSGAAMQQLDDEALGAFSRRLPWGSYGMLARASLSSPNLGIALRRWCRHHGLLTDDIHLTLAEHGNSGDATLTLAERVTLPAAQREFSLVHVLRNIHGLACWYVDSRIALREACFPFAAPPHASAYPYMFPTGELRFEAAQAQLRFDARYLALPLRRDEASLQTMLRRALPLTVLQYRRDRLLVQQVRQALATSAAQAHSAQGLARLLNTSARTLHRQLKEEGASLQALKDEVRCERARDLLYRSNRPIKQVAAAVGFQNEKSFTRAFRGWTGVGPAAFRSSATGR